MSMPEGAAKVFSAKKKQNDMMHHLSKLEVDKLGRFKISKHYNGQHYQRPV
jgi:hypothetical protein